MSNSPIDRRLSTRFWQVVGTALAALARKGGGSLSDSPLPELRHTAREWQRARDLSSKQSG
jgi:hypothetical protein